MRYQVFTSAVEPARNQLDIINEYIQESQDTDFIGKWALLVEWRNVHPFDHLSFFISPSLFEEETANFLNSVS